MLNANIQSADTYAFYQAKNIPQTSTQLAADQLGHVLPIPISLATLARKSSSRSRMRRPR